MQGELWHYLLTVAITTVLADAIVLEPLKRLFKTDGMIYHGLHCYMCIGFWVGLGMAIADQSMIYNPLSSAIVTSFLSYIIGNVIDRLSK